MGKLAKQIAQKKAEEEKKKLLNPPKKRPKITLPKPKKPTPKKIK